MDQRIAFVTCERLPDIHGDDRLVAKALQRRGFQVTAAVWNDPAVDWRPFASVVIRAAWDYHLDERESGRSCSSTVSTVTPC